MRLTEDQAKTPLGIALTKQKKENPLGLTCSSCLKFARWDECRSTNPRYFCKGHTALKGETE